MLFRSKFKMGITVLLCYHLGHRHCTQIPMVNSDSAELWFLSDDGTGGVHLVLEMEG
jgi:hypothetical protein